MRNSLLLTLSFSIYFLTLFLSTDARHHFQYKHKHSHFHNSPQISLPPSPLPSPSSNAPEDTPSPSPSPSSDENYHNASGLFDVRTFGAIGDGITDDTESFKMAWDTACQSESPLNVIFVPRGFSFVIQSTIFTGPCKAGLVFKVMYLFCYLHHGLKLRLRRN